jgi:uncharacterized protein (DUF2267 family)
VNDRKAARRRAYPLGNNGATDAFGNRDGSMEHVKIDAFDAPVREARAWLGDVMRETGLDERRAFAALRGVLQAIRDEITTRQSGRLAAKMPALIRGLFFEGWDPGRPAAEHELARFIARVRSYAAIDDGELDYPSVARGVIRVIEDRMPGPTAQIKRTLPKELRLLWPASLAEETTERRVRRAAEERVASYEALQEERGAERGAPMAPHQNRPPAEQHRGGPLPNVMK